MRLGLMVCAIAECASPMLGLAEYPCGLMYLPILLLPIGGADFW